MTPLLLADALDVIFPIAMIALPLIVGVGFYRLSDQPLSIPERIDEELSGSSRKRVAKECPSCGSKDARIAAGDDYFLVNLERVCNVCGTEYCYPPSRRLAKSLITIGIGQILGGTVCGFQIFYELHERRAAFALLCLSVVGALAIVYGMVRLRVANAYTDRPDKTRPRR